MSALPDRLFPSFKRFFASRTDLFLFLLATLAGGWLLFSNLNGIIYLSEDEARPFQLMTSGQLMYLLSHPFFLLFHTQASVFYLVAFLNFLSLILFYVLCRVSVGEKIAGFSSLIYAVFPLRIDYARMLYPASYMEVFFLLAVLFSYLGLSRRQSWWMFGAGASLACVFLIHYMGYALIAGVVLGCAGFWFFQRESFRQKRPVFFLLKGIFGFLVFFLAVVLILKWCYRYDFYSTIWNFSHEAGVYKERFSSGVSYPIDFFSRITSSVFNSTLIFIAFVATIMTVYFFLKKRDMALGFFILVYISAASILFFLSTAGFHLLFERHFIWLISFLCLAMGAVVVAWADRLGRNARYGLITIFMVGIGISFFQSYLVVKETFGIHQITATLRENDIEKKSLLTFWKLYEPGDTKSSSLIPLYVSKSLIESDPMWHMHAKFTIAWPDIYKAYRMRLCDHILTSGIDVLRAEVGTGDPMLKNVQPVASWRHPYSEFSHRGFYYPGSDWRIGLYRLSDVFSPENFEKMKKKLKK